ncbi:scaffold attachment factor B2-like isoform X2 [Daphnia pulex]|uniref:scaffold attachment factor B2-like isoform X2 n=1 Tax=Daphnia pulex TaxID=6669 RepID=UPI001EDD8511|nr:scaffold attachment factor B2-like isoform X2 [Daphnia pulex]
MSKSRGNTILGKIVNKKECIPKLARQKYPEQTSCSTSTKTSPIEKREPQGQEAKTNNPISDNDWKRNLYVRGLSTSTRPKDLQKHLLKVTGAETVACSLIPGEPYYFKITMATSKDASKCIRLLNDTKLFGRKIRVERKERALIGDIARSRSNSFDKELKEINLLVNKNDSKANGTKLRNRRRSRSHDRELKSSGTDRNQKIVSMSNETKMRSKSRERNRERSRSPVKRRHRRMPSIYWDIPPFGFEYMTPMQYKAMRAQVLTTQMQGELFVDNTISTGSVEMEDTSYIVPEGCIVHKLFIGGLLSHLNQDYVEELLECERRQLEEKIQFEKEREWQRIERETLEREKIELQRERERFEREQRIEKEKIKAEREELKRRQASVMYFRSIAKKENLICASKTTTQGPMPMMTPVIEKPSVPIIVRLPLQFRSKLKKKKKCQSYYTKRSSTV